METVDIIASGYEWICPECSTFNEEIECSAVVKCNDCKKEFETNPPEHAF